MKRNQAHALPEALEPQLQHLGAVVRSLRLARGMPAQQAAARAGVSVPTARRIERGHAGVAIGAVVRYLAALYPNLTLADALDEHSSIRQAALRQQASGRRARSAEPDLGDLSF